MKHIKPYQIFESSSAAALTPVQINWLDRCTTGSWKLNSSTGLIDIEGYFNCNSQSLKELNGVKFGKVSGHFDCSNNRLTSLEGAPQSIVGSFYCMRNQITSLEGAPQTVGVSFDCRSNLLTSLEGAPQSVGGDFYCMRNRLTSLEGAPQSIGGSFYCRENRVSEETLKSIFSLMRKGESYQQALEELWPKMKDEDRALMYKQMPSLSPEETRKYQALAKFFSIKSYI